MSYLTERERNQIEILLKQGYKQCEIAKALGRCRNTIANEIKRGKITLLNSDLTERVTYDAYRGQCVRMENSKNKGVDLKIGNNLELADFVEKQILENKYSPYAAIQSAIAKGYDVNFCERTLYNYIHKGIFFNLNSKNLRKQKKKESAEPLRPAYNNKKGRLIDERPKEINERKNLGNWEMDLVLSGHGDKSCLLVLTERKTRMEIIRRIPDKSSFSVCSALNDLERLYSGSFRQIFHTITCDNGSEFLDTVALEKSIYSDSKRTTIYYCHPYSSSERGSNENANRLIRYWLPKGCHISNYDDDYIQFVENWLNDYPRKLFNGLSARQVLQCELTAC